MNVLTAGRSPTWKLALALMLVNALLAVLAIAGPSTAQAPELTHFEGLGYGREVSPGMVEVRLPGGGGTFLTHKEADVIPPTDLPLEHEPLPLSGEQE